MNFLHRTWAEIDLSALIHNFNIIKSKAGTAKIMAVVKADAYGHSVEDVALALEKAGTDSFAVSNIDEALELRQIGITKPILILGYTPTEAAYLLDAHNISQCVYSTEYALALSAQAALKNLKIKIHIKLDTGMSRLGFNCRDNSLEGINEAINAAKLDNFYLEGIFTHFSSADRSPEQEDGFTKAQFSRFMLAKEKFSESGLSPEYCHCCNSAGTLLDEDKHLNLCRPGIILYGLTPSNDLNLQENLIPVMTLKSVVSMVKEIKKGDVVSYGKTFKAEKDMKIATVSAGYADGYPRLLSNKAYVLINGKKANLLGRVCMDQICVDISDIENVKMGDEVILFGKDLPIDILAEICKTINYELVCGISKRVPRVVIE